MYNIHTKIWIHEHVCMYIYIFVCICTYHVHHPVTEPRWKCCVKFQTTASIRMCHPEHLFGDYLDQLNRVENQKPQALSFGFNLFFLERKCALSWNWWRQHLSTGNYARLHGFLFCQLILMYWKWELTCFYAIWMQDWKDMRERNIEAENYRHMKIEMEWG